MTHTPLKEGDAVVVAEHTPFAQKGAKGTVESVLGDLASVNFDGDIKYFCPVRCLELAEPQQLSLPDVESDPHGTPQHAPGAKLDAGKIRAADALRAPKLVRLTDGQIAEMAAQVWGRASIAPQSVMGFARIVEAAVLRANNLETPE